MKNLKRKFIFALLIALLAAANLPAFAASGEKFSAAELKLMSTFLSNFTELGFMNFDAKELTDANNPADMIRFGIWHNYINNFKSRIAPCKVKGCEWGSLTIEGKYVTESVRKYFGVNYTKLASVTESDPPYYYDGKRYHFEGADGDAVYYARVDRAVQNPSGEIVMTGELYNVENKNDILGAFEAVAKPYKYGGRNTWSIVSMSMEN